MITRWIIRPPQLTRFVTDQEGSLHLEMPAGGEGPVIAYLRQHLAALEAQVLANVPPPVERAPRLARQGHAGRIPVEGGPGSAPGQYPMGTFNGGTGPIPATHGPTPGYGPPQAGPTVNGQPFVNPNAPAPPGFAYGVVPQGGMPTAMGGRPDMMKYGWGNNGGAVPPMPDPDAPGAAAMTNLNPVPGVCADCHRLAIACDAQPNQCPAAEERAAARAAEAAQAAGRGAVVAAVAADAKTKADAGDESVTNGLPPTH